MSLFQSKNDDETAKQNTVEHKNKKENQKKQEDNTKQL